MDTLQGKQCKIEHTNTQCWYYDFCTYTKYHCETCPRYLELSYLMENSNLPKSKQKVIKLSVPKQDEDAYNRLADIKSNIYDFVQDGKSLYIGSRHTGNSKTSWSIKLLHKYFEEVWNCNGFRVRGLFINVPDFLMRCKDFESGDEDFYELKRLIRTVDLVVWDDIASSEMSSYDYAQILPYIDYRSLSELSNIYNGNFDNKDALTEKLGERLASRIWTRNTEIVIFNSKDMR